MSYPIDQKVCNDHIISLGYGMQCALFSRLLDGKQIRDSQSKLSQKIILVLKWK